MSKPLHNARHKITDNDQIADTNSKALDRDCSVKDHSRVRVCDLTERKETGSAAVEVSGATGL